MKKIFGIVLTVVMVLSLGGLSVFAAGHGTGRNGGGGNGGRGNCTVSSGVCSRLEGCPSDGTCTPRRDGTGQGRQNSGGQGHCRR